MTDHEESGAATAKTRAMPPVLGKGLRRRRRAAHADHDFPMHSGNESVLGESPISNKFG